MKQSAPFFSVRSSAAWILLSLAVFVAVSLEFGTGSGVFGADEVPDELVKLRMTFDKDIDFATRPIRDRYVSRLEILKRSLGSRGDARGAAAVQDELDRIRITSGGPSAFAKFAGTWKLAYSDGQTRRYMITPDGVVTGTNFDGKSPIPVNRLVVKGNDVLLDYTSGGVMERLKIADKNLLIEHFSPRTLYPNSPANYHATGILVSVQRE